jgi:tape measure domain-containing protein
MADEDMVVIDLSAKFNDQTEPGVSSATSKTDKFTESIKKEKKQMDSMNRTKGQVMLEAKDKASKIIRDVADRAKSLASKTFKVTVKAVDLATKPMRSIFNFATSVKGVIAGLATGYAADKLIKSPLELADNLTNAQIGFETMFKSADKAKKMMSDIQNFAIKTPFSTTDVIQNTQTMMAYGFQAKDVIKDMEIIGNQAAAVGKGSDGLQSIALALGQMQAHGKVDAQDMNQLTNVGVKGWDYLAKAMGKTKAQVMDMSQKGLIPADKGVQAILNGMKEFDGMMDKTANSTASGLLSQIQDTFDIDVFTKWGQGLQSGVIGGLSKFNDWLGKNKDKIAKWGDALKDIGKDISEKVTKKIEDLGETADKVINSSAFKQAPTAWAKIKILWNKIVIEPFDKWWDGSGKKWLAGKAEKIGQGLGSGLKNGILGILGIDIHGAASDGETIGGSFASGFSKGFDAKKVGEGIKKAFKGLFKDAGTLFSGNKSSTSGLSAAILGYLGYKGVKGAVGVGKAGAGAVKGIKGLVGLFGKGKKGTSDIAGLSNLSTASMSVDAAVVNINGKITNSGPSTRTEWNAAKTAASGAAGTGTTKALTSGAAGKALTSGGSTPLLPSSTATGTSLLGKSSKLIMNPATQTLAKVGAGLGSGAATAGGAAAVGASSVLGGALGAAGIVSGGVDIYKGIKAKSDKVKKDKYITGGTKIGMVGAGAATGAGIGAIFGGIGAVPGALIGAGVGGLGALLGGNKLGKAISKSTDKGGRLYNAWNATKNGVGWAAGKAGSGIGWVANKVGQGASWAGNKIGSGLSWAGNKIGKGAHKAKTAISDVGISGINIAAGAWTKAKKPLQKAWSGVSGWFNSHVYKPVKNGAKTAGNWIGDKFNKAKSNVQSKWKKVSGWFGSNVYTPVKNGARTAGAWVGDKFDSAKSTVKSGWSKVSRWFGSNVYTPIKNNAKTAGTWLGDKFNDAKSNVQAGWSKVSNWFGSNVYDPVKSGAETAGTWIGDKFSAAKNSIQSGWANVSSWFDKNVWSPLQGAATNAGQWIGDRINDAKNGVSKAKDYLAGLGDTGSKSTGLKTSTGKSSVLKHAEGGFFDKPHKGLVAEAGPEAIIPLSSQRRSRGLALWEEAGRRLGVTTYAKRAIVGTLASTPRPVNMATAPSSISTPVSVKVTGNEFVFKIEGSSDPDAVVAAIKAKAPEIGNVLAYQIALFIKKSFNNRPARANS